MKHEILNFNVNGNTGTEHQVSHLIKKKCAKDPKKIKTTHISFASW